MRFKLTGPLFNGKTGDGSAAGPAYTFANDPDTGMYRVGTNSLGFATGGTGRWSIDSSGHLMAVADNTYDIGAAAATRPRSIYAGSLVQTPVASMQQLWLTDGIAAPTATVGVAKIFVDTADGDLKVRFGDGTLKVIVADT